MWNTTDFRSISILEIAFDILISLKHIKMWHPDLDDAVYYWIFVIRLLWLFATLWQIQCTSCDVKVASPKGSFVGSLSMEKRCTVYPQKYAHGFCFAVLCCGYTLTDFPIPIRLTSLALWQSNDCPSASKATLMNMDKYFMWIHYERLHNHNKAKHNKTVCICLGIYCTPCCEGTRAH